MNENQNQPIKSQLLPVTSKMLAESKQRLIHRMDCGFSQLRSEIHGVKSEVHDLKSEIHEMKSDVHDLKSEIHEVKSDVHDLKSEFHGVKSEVQGMKSELHRIALLVEEQNARNKYVLDGYSQLYELIENKL